LAVLTIHVAVIAFNVLGLIAIPAGRLARLAVRVSVLVARPAPGAAGDPRTPAAVRAAPVS